MRTVLDTRFADTRAADLSLAYGLPRLAALGTHRVELGGLPVELRVLGASHQVVVGSFSETVACLPERPGSLPVTESGTVDGFVAEFESRCLPLDPAAIESVVAACAADENALVGAFPSSPLAVTALRAWASPDGVAWRTWHAYPQAGEVVETLSVVRPV